MGRISGGRMYGFEVNHLQIKGCIAIMIFKTSEIATVGQILMVKYAVQNKLSPPRSIEDLLANETTLVPD